MFVHICELFVVRYQASDHRSVDLQWRLPRVHLQNSCFSHGRVSLKGRDVIFLQCISGCVHTHARRMHAHACTRTMTGCTNVTRTPRRCHACIHASTHAHVHAGTRMHTHTTPARIHTHIHWLASTHTLMHAESTHTHTHTHTHTERACVSISFFSMQERRDAQRASSCRLPAAAQS